MKVSPNLPRDYDELLRTYQEKKQIDIEKIVNDILPDKIAVGRSKLRSSFLVLKSVLCLNILTYNQLISKGILDDRYIYFYKLIVYDYYDFCQAYNTFCGTQIYSVARSICDHTRIFILCLCDQDFLQDYFSEYTDEEKKERYYRKRESKISKQLEKISEEARKLNNENEFYAESAIFNLTTELYTSLMDKLGELSHLTEITLAKEFISSDPKLEFSFSNNLKCLKFHDEIIQYFISTTLTIFLLLGSENIEYTSPIIVLYNFLNALDEELFKMKNIDKILSEMKNRLFNIWMDNLEE